jgi:hypothetical protein
MVRASPQPETGEREGEGEGVARARSKGGEKELLKAFAALDACVLDVAALEEVTGGSEVGRWRVGRCDWKRHLCAQRC